MKASKPKKELVFLFPNSLSRRSGELYGEFNLLTSEWTDGLVPKMVRQCVQAGTDGSDNRKWIIFDGPVDAVWIENMNTVTESSPTWQSLHSLTDQSGISAVCHEYFVPTVALGVNRRASA